MKQDLISKLLFLFALAACACFSSPYSATAQTFTTLYRFSPTVQVTNIVSKDYWNIAFPTNGDGANPDDRLLLSSNFLYGTAQRGGRSGHGTVFRVNTEGAGFTNLHDFTAYIGTNGTCIGAGAPFAGLILSGTNLYGTESGSGFSGGAIFKMSADGTTFSNIHRFEQIRDNNSNDGATPIGDLVLEGNTLYGTASNGGRGGHGTVFKINTDGTGFTVLHHFLGSTNFPVPDGASPRAGLVLLGKRLYGTTFGGGANGNGTIFAINTDGKYFSILHYYAGGEDGYGPNADLILANGTLYGTAYSDAARGPGAVYKIKTDGSGFDILHTFTAPLVFSHYGTNGDGSILLGSLVLLGNTLYGTAQEGGALDRGNVFQLDAYGADFSIVHSFRGDGEGIGPRAGLILSGNTLYGTTSRGGDPTNGTVFRISLDSSK